MFGNITKKELITDNSDWLRQLVSVVPSDRQYAHSKLKYYNFIHFGMNTMTDCEWGDGQTPVSVFAPTDLDTDQWCRVLKETGSAGIIITAKHHDGFCLWDTKTTDYNVMNSPFGRDVVGLLAQSCQKYGLRLGIYLSPWDRHEKTYGSAAYNDFYVQQLTELAANYGDVFTFWFDGACGEGPNGKKQVYDFERYYATIRRLQPQACLAISGPDIRWIGNEGGHVRESEWSVIPTEFIEPEKVAADSQTKDDGGAHIEKIAADRQDLGSRAFLKHFDRYIFSPAECDVSVNLGWFWHDDNYYKGKKIRTSEDIAKIYMNTVGGNASLLLNVPPDPRGLINDREIALLQNFKAIIDKKFKRQLTPTAVSVLSTEGTPSGENADALLADTGRQLLPTEQAIVLTFDKKEKIGVVALEEDIRYSQRVEAFEIYAKKGGSWKKVHTATVIGSGKFCEIDCETDELLINLVRSRAEPVIKNIRVYAK